MDEPVQLSFRNHSLLYRRLRKTFHFGNSKKPIKNSLPLTECTVDLIQNIAKGQSLGNLDVDYASHILSQACFPPAMPAPTLIIAMIYLERLKGFNSDYLHQASPSELFLVSLVVASKFLFDRGDSDCVYNDEWATFGNLDLADLNRLEREFLNALDWSCYVDNEAFLSQLSRLEALVSMKEYLKRSQSTDPHMTYTELLSLFNYLKNRHNDDDLNFWKDFKLDELTKSICIWALAYCAAVSVLVMSFSIVFSFHLVANHLHHQLDSNDNFTLQIIVPHNYLIADSFAYKRYPFPDNAQIETAHFIVQRNQTADQLKAPNYYHLLKPKSSKILKCS